MRELLIAYDVLTQNFAKMYDLRARSEKWVKIKG